MPMHTLRMTPELRIDALEALEHDRTLPPAVVHGWQRALAEIPDGEWVGLDARMVIVLLGLWDRYKEEIKGW